MDTKKLKNFAKNYGVALARCVSAVGITWLIVRNNASVSFTIESHKPKK